MAEQLGTKKPRAKKPTDDAGEEKDDETYAALKAAWDKLPNFQRKYREATATARRKFDRLLKDIPLPETDVEDDEDDEDEDE
jgi:hypothetical protein